MERKISMERMTKNKNIYPTYIYRPTKNSDLEFLLVQFSS